MKPGRAVRSFIGTCRNAFQEYLEAITVATERLERLTKAMAAALPDWKREPVVRALMSLRGVAVINGMTLVAEAGDLTRFDSRSARAG